MKKVLVFGVLLGLLTTVSWAQRGRTVGGVGPTARLPGATRMPPNAVGIPHRGIAPNATSTGTGKTVKPNATAGQTAKTVGPNATKLPHRVVLPDADGITGRTIGPIR